MAPATYGSSSYRCLRLAEFADNRGQGLHRRAHWRRQVVAESLESCKSLEHSSYSKHLF